MTNGDWFMLGCCLGFSPILFSFIMFVRLVRRETVTIVIPGEFKEE